MERYWIRNRGRTQGPFTIDRIQGLLRRGRFNRHFYVSEDKKEWLPASEFPELFEGVGPARGGGGGGGDDDEVFQGGGSPFESDYDSPARSSSRGGSRTQSPFEDDDDEEYEDDDEGEWEEGYAGSSDGLVGWIEKNSLPVIGVLVLVLGAVGWFVFLRESFTQDKADLDSLIAITTKINTAHAGNPDANTWVLLSESIDSELSAMVSRLMNTASNTDQIKQELLFCARDDIPRIFRELPEGQDGAQKRLLLRFSRIETMINNKQRYYDGPPVGGGMPQPSTPAAAPAVAAAPGPEPSEDNVNGDAGVSNDSAADAQAGADPAMAMTASDEPMMDAKDDMSSQPAGDAPPPGAGGVPGRPPVVKIP